MFVKNRFNNSSTKKLVQAIPDEKKPIPAVSQNKNYFNGHNAITSFLIIFVLRTIGIILFPIIPDCDEVFNYWEPLHYLQYGLGFQTWEYSPDYSIRSYGYLILYGVPAMFLDFALSLVPVLYVKQWKRYFVFQGMRIALTALSAVIEVVFCKVVAEKISSNVGWCMYLFLLSSPGMWHASSAFLPSSFAMYTTMLCFIAWINSFSLGVRNYSVYSLAYTFAPSVFSVATGCIVGWPFSGAVGIPFVIEEIFLNNRGKSQTDSLIILMKRISSFAVASFGSLIILLMPMVAVDWIFYRKLTIVPWNIVYYNVVKGGSELYGTEPWTYYLINGTLNLNITFWLGLITIPALYFSYTFTYNDIVSGMNVLYLAVANGRPYQLLMVQMSTVYLWMTIFTLQPHKEERFLYVIYPLICYNAAVSLTFIKTRISNLLSGYIGNRVSKLFYTMIFGGVILLSVSRMMSMYMNYSGSFGIYKSLYSHSLINEQGGFKNLCLGNEWYRFPSHYVLHDSVRVRWIESGFGGQLPKYFRDDYSNDTSSVLNRRRGTYEKTRGFNLENRKEKDRYIKDLKECNYLITFNFHKQNEEEGELKQFIEKKAQVKQKDCIKFLDSTATGSGIHRALYIPTRGEEVKKFGEYCWYEFIV